MGYLGGSKKKPTYHDLGDHTETIQMEFDPAQVSYSQLLEVFWRSHSPTYESSTQYMSAVFVHDEEQEKTARASLKQFETEHKTKAYTKIIKAKATDLTVAEDYHQKYYLQNDRLVLESFKFSSIEELIDSPLAARANAYYAGHGNYEDACKDVKSWSISDYAKDKILKTLLRKSFSKKGAVCGKV